MKIRRSTVALLIVLPAALASFCAAQNPLAALEDAAKEKAAETAIETLLNNQLPLTLNANDVYPTVANLPGGPFNPQPLKLTADELNQPLAPGDYTINTLDFCSEYSVHAPGAGVAYVLGPYEGKAAGAIGALIWRGTEQYRINPNSLQAVSWAIQSGLSYTQMPKTYQPIIDQVIPDFKPRSTATLSPTLKPPTTALRRVRSFRRSTRFLPSWASPASSHSAPSASARSLPRKTPTISSASRRSSRASKAVSTRL